MRSYYDYQPKGLVSLYLSSINCKGPFPADPGNHQPFELHPDIQPGLWDVTLGKILKCHPKIISPQVASLRGVTHMKP